MANLKELNRRIEEEKSQEKKYICNDCKDTGIISKKFGEVSTCFKCLRAGRLG